MNDWGEETPGQMDEETAQIVFKMITGFDWVDSRRFTSFTMQSSGIEMMMRAIRFLVEHEDLVFGRIKEARNLWHDMLRAERRRAIEAWRFEHEKEQER